jgi:hypothetical protein
MPNSLTIHQELAESLGLPEARGAHKSQRYAVQRLMEWQETKMKQIEARQKAKKPPTFLPPSIFFQYGILNKDTLEKK